MAGDDSIVDLRAAVTIGLVASHRQLAERIASLEALDALLGTITRVLDVRDVFDRIFEVSRQAMAHDAMSIAVPTDDGTRVTLHATTGAIRHLPVRLEVPLPDPSLLHRPWEFEIIDDELKDPRYATLPSARAGMRSLLTIPVRLDEQLRAWVNFFSGTPGRFTAADVPMARRISAHIALALSHQQLAEESRRRAELASRAANIDLLDEVLASVSEAGELSEVFDRISALTRKVLPHDAVILAVFLADGLHAKPYVTSGLDTMPVPERIEIPDALRDPNWEYDLIDNMSLMHHEPSALVAAKAGFQSALRVAVRLDGRVAAGLGFMSRSPAAFKKDDVPIARRIADRIALRLARERGLEAARRADEAAARAARLEARVRALTEELDARAGYRRVIGESPSWRKALTQATQVAPTDTTVLLLGESGTGKEVVARLLHRASQRRDGPFVALNCAALPEQLLEAELFGYERGAFTGAVNSKPGQLEQASGGVLFLDEVGEMSLPAQAKFLRVLQEREFQRLGGTRVLRTDARVIAATNRDLLKGIAQGQFREDLFYRLNVFAIRLPALRDRKEDVLPLSEAFLAEFGRAFGRPPAGISREAKQLLLAYHWPGNVRELRNILERAAILCDGGLITSEHLSMTPAMMAASPAAREPAAAPAPVASPPPPPPPPAAPYAPPQAQPTRNIQSVEREMIERALRHARFNKSQAAKELGLTRHQLYVRMRKYGLE
jgi:transcriptional regulator with GAF, ATPase, and Fis domain